MQDDRDAADEERDVLRQDEAAEAVSVGSESRSESFSGMADSADKAAVLALVTTQR